MSIGVVCIGCGFIGARHLANLATLGGVRIVAVADSDEARAREQGQRYGARSYTDWQAMLAQEHPDAAYICLPPFARGEPELALTAAGIPFFAEKPLAATAEVPERIAEAVLAARLLTSVGYHWRYLDTIERVRRLVEAHPPRLAMGYWFDFVPPAPWWTRCAASGGQVVEQTTHIFDLTRYLLGEPEQVYTAACREGLVHHPESDIDAASASTLRFPSGAIAVIASTCLVHYPHRIGLWLYAQDLVAECGEFTLRIEQPEGTEVYEPQVDPFLAEDQAFMRAVQSGRQDLVRVPYAEALRSHRLTMRAVAAAGAGRPLSLAEQG